MSFGMETSNGRRRAKGSHCRNPQLSHTDPSTDSGDGPTAEYVESGMTRIEASRGWRWRRRRTCSVGANDTGEVFKGTDEDMASVGFEVEDLQALETGHFRIVYVG